MKHTSKGFSLLELIIAMVLSLIMLSALTYLVIESQRSRATLECMKAVQDGGRAALDMVVRDVSVAGYRGCSSKLSSSFLYQSGLDLSALSPEQQDQLTYELALTVPISGFGGMQNATTPLVIPQPMLANTLLSDFDSGGVIDLNYTDHPPAELKNRQQEYRNHQQTSFLDGSPVTTPSYGDLITTRSIGRKSWNLVRATTSGADPLVVINDEGTFPDVGDLLYVGDCNKGTIFMVTAVTGPSTVNGINNAYTLAHLDSAIGNTLIRNRTADLGGTQPMIFERDAIVASIDTTHYALGVSQFSNPSGERVPSLYRSRFESNAIELNDANYSSTPEEVAPGIADLGIFFGVSDAPATPPTRLSRMVDINENDVLQTADLSVQASAIRDCGAGDDDDSMGWSHFTMRFERFLHLRNIRGASD